MESRKELPAAIERMFKDDKAYLLNVNIDPEDNVFPMISPGEPVDKILLDENDFLDLNIVQL